MKPFSLFFLLVVLASACSTKNNEKNSVTKNTAAHEDNEAVDSSFSSESGDSLKSPQSHLNELLRAFEKEKKKLP
ncbi:MAG: hypothetical protein ACHQF2_09845, partial [Flavobacteriales bacterium]